MKNIFGICHNNFLAQMTDCFLITHKQIIKHNSTLSMEPWPSTLPVHVSLNPLKLDLSGVYIPFSLTHSTASHGGGGDLFKHCNLYTVRRHKFLIDQRAIVSCWPREMRFWLMFRKDSKSCMWSTIPITNMYKVHQTREKSATWIKKIK